jgi:hypothetical protein
MDFIRLRYVPANRHQKKIITKEIEKTIKVLAWIENNFITAVFEESRVSYHEIYTAANTIWLNNVSYLHKNNKLKHIDVDSHYFSDNYKPLERPRL